MYLQLLFIPPYILKKYLHVDTYSMGLFLSKSIIIFPEYGVGMCPVSPSKGVTPGGVITA